MFRPRSPRSAALFRWIQSRHARVGVILFSMLCLSGIADPFASTSSSGQPVSTPSSPADSLLTYSKFRVRLEQALAFVEKRLPANVQSQIREFTVAHPIVAPDLRSDPPVPAGKMRTVVRDLYRLLVRMDPAIRYPWPLGESAPQSFFEDATPATNREAEQALNFEATPLPPQNVEAQGEDRGVSLRWNPVEGASLYKIWRSGDSQTPLTEVEGGLVSENAFRDGGLKNGKTYYYAVSAGNLLSWSELSSETAVTPQAASPERLGTSASGGSNGAAALRSAAFSATAAPEGVPPALGPLSASPGNGTVKLTWTALPSATSYTIRRSTTSGSGYADFTGNTTSGTELTVTGLVNGTTYYFVAFASNAAGAGPQSPEVAAKPVAPPVAPSGLRATPSNAQISLNWNAVSGATSYRVLRSTTRGSGYADFAGNVTSTLSLVNSGLSNGVAYFYVVAALNSSGQSPNSAEVTATPVAPPAAPAGLTATPGDGLVTLRWTAVS
ncbi:MAG: hypothetical protein RLZZ244_1532, partial [Verrucomicrobiota bacterium]